MYVKRILKPFVHYSSFSPMSVLSETQSAAPRSTLQCTGEHVYPAIQIHSSMDSDMPWRMVFPENIAIDPGGYRHRIPREYSSRTVPESPPNETSMSEHSFDLLL